MTPQPPLTRREYVAVATLQSLIAHPNSANVADDALIAAAVRNTDKFLAELDRTAASVSMPEGFPDPPDGYADAGFGKPGNDFKAADKNDVVACLFRGEWLFPIIRFEGTDPSKRYALRRGTPIARANGIPD